MYRYILTRSVVKLNRCLLYSLSAFLHLCFHNNCDITNCLYLFLWNKAVKKPSYIVYLVFTRYKCSVIHKYLSELCKCSVIHNYLSELCKCSVIHTYLSELCKCSVIHKYLSELCKCSVIHKYLSELFNACILLYTTILVK